MKPKTDTTKPTTSKKKNVSLTIYRDKRREWRWRIKAANGRIIADSGEGYKRQAACLKGLEAVSAVFFSLKRYADSGNARTTYQEETP